MRAMAATISKTVRGMVRRRRMRIEFSSESGIMIAFDGRHSLVEGWARCCRASPGGAGEGTCPYVSR